MNTPNSDDITLIVPLASDRPDFDQVMPYVFGFASDGTLLCVHSIMGLPTARFSRIIFTILRKHDERYMLSELLRMQFRRLGLAQATVCVLAEPTPSQAATVARTIQQEGITGPIFVKDGDGYFHLDFTLHNGIAIYPLDALSRVDPRNKSYVALDDQYCITNIIEKRIISRYFNAGGYLFQSAQDFVNYYTQLAHAPVLYMSHIVYSMLLDGHTFTPMFCDDYQDWGTRDTLKYYADKI